MYTRFLDGFQEMSRSSSLFFVGVYMRQYEARTFGDFLRKIAYDYARYGYTEYAVREIPQGKDIRAVDEKLLRVYGVTYHYTTRAKRRKAGKANVAYVRYKRRFILMAQPGEGETWNRVVRRNLQVEPLLIGGYELRVRGKTPVITIAERRWRRVRALVLGLALHPEPRVRHLLVTWLQRVFPYSFPGIVQQKRRLVRAVNRRRKTAGLPLVTGAALAPVTRVESGDGRTWYY